MKKRVLTFSLLMIAFFGFSQIPNQGFEEWTSMGNYEVPNFWGTMNNTTASSSVYTATKGTPGNVGSAYLKLVSKTVGASVVNGIAVSGALDSITLQPKSGFPFTQRPLSFTGKWQHMISGSSQGSVSVTLTRWNNGQREVVATANQTLSGMVMSWGSFSINFNYQSSEAPDTCIIVLKASGSAPANGDYLYVDNLAFAGSSTGISEMSKSEMKSFPNPVTNQIDFSFPKTFEKGDQLMITDMFGNLVSVNTINEALMTISTVSYANGTYLYKILGKDGQQYSSGKFIVIH